MTLAMTVEEYETSGLLHRVRGEYREMPGLRLTASQARRLWNMGERECTTVLEALVAGGFLRLTAQGLYIRASDDVSRPRRQGVFHGTQTR